MIVVDLPPAPSVNRTRKVDWCGHRTLKKWVNHADGLVLVQKCRKVDPLRMTRLKRFEVTVVLNERMTAVDADNPIKATVDYLRRINLIENDARKNMRRLVVEWGDDKTAPEGMRVMIRETAA